VSNAGLPAIVVSGYFFATDPPQVHPRRRNSTSRIGIGIPRSQSKIHPIFPFSEGRIAILLSDCLFIGPEIGYSARLRQRPDGGRSSDRAHQRAPRSCPLRYPCRRHSNWLIGHCRGVMASKPLAIGDQGHHFVFPGVCAQRPDMAESIRFSKRQGLRPRSNPAVVVQNSTQGTWRKAHDNFA
jgi:hypothetical protein